MFARDVVSTIRYPDRGAVFRHLVLNTGGYGKDMHGLLGVTFRNLRVTVER